jgi:hypothetical protein
VGKLVEIITELTAIALIFFDSISDLVFLLLACFTLCNFFRRLLDFLLDDFELTLEIVPVALSAKQIVVERILRFVLLLTAQRVVVLMPLLDGFFVV